jgi:signal transduction histidine kinase/Tfp pilus assembly protein PilF
MIKKKNIRYLLCVKYCMLVMIIFMTVRNCFLINTHVFAQNKTTDSLKSLLLMHDLYDTTRVNILTDLAYHFHTTDPEKTLRYAIEADSISEILGYTKGKADSYGVKGLYYWMISEYSTALEMYKKSLKLSLQSSDYNRIASCYNNMGLVYYEWGEREKALEHFKKSLKLSEKTQDNSGIAKSNINIGLVYSDRGDYASALDFYQQSMMISIQENDLNTLASALTNIGLIYYSQKDYQKALSYYDKAIHISKKINDKNGYAIDLINYGIIFSELGDYSDAMIYFFESLEIAQETGDKNLISVNYFNIGDAYQKMGEYEKAYEYFMEGLQISLEIGSKSLQAWHYSGLGEYFFFANDASQACEYSRKAFSISGEIGEIELILQTSRDLSKACALKGLYNEAYEYLMIFQTLNDSLKNEENTRKFIELEYQYLHDKEKELARAEQEKRNAIHHEELKRQKFTINFFIIGLSFSLMLLGTLLYNYIEKKRINKRLDLQKRETELKNTELSQLIQDKDRFLQILAHDLRNPFNGLLGLTDYLLENIDHIDREQLFTTLSLVNQSQKNTFTLLNDLLLWSQSHANLMNIKPEQIKLSDFCYEVIHERKNHAEHKNIQIDYQISDNLQIFADRNMLKSVLRNLLSNAIKFTRQNGTIFICAEQNHHNYIISIADNGIGIGKDHLDKLWKFNNPYITRDTEGNKGTGFGLTLCKDFVEKHGGTIWVESETGKGSTFSFTIPINLQ